METNESILTRKVVGLDDRKMLGKVNELRVDCDTLAVSHYIVGNVSTNAPLALPFSSSLSVGDTFLTIQSRDEFVPAATSDAQAIVRDGFQLTGVEVYSRTGNKLGVVKSYEFDPVFGTVERVLLDDGTAFSASTFVFFAPEFVFVDDGGKTAEELRASQGASAEPVKAAADKEPEGVSVGAVLGAVAESSAETADEEPSESSVDEMGTSDEDAALVEFLLGMTLTDDVTSADGAFTASKGTKLTQEIIDEAQAHDALLLLTMSVEG